MNNKSYKCFSCGKNFERKNVLLVKKSIVLTGVLGDIPHEFAYAICKKCRKELENE